MQTIFNDVDDQFGSESLSNKSMIGQKFNVIGELSGNEDIVYEGRFEGSINLASKLYVSKTALIKADVHVHSVVVYGEIDGNIEADDRIEVKTGGVVRGDMEAPHIVIEDGARVHGRLNIKE
ncbi:MAG: polymer-forming cytoskeletal protein [Candidatus Delongbacteria bacterium]|nr:polymer-forming cytoskeletal protein [Candidatus Delongbacteria bacterium]